MGFGSMKFITAVKTEAEWQEAVERTTPATLCVCDIHSQWGGPCTALGKAILNMSSDYAEYARPARIWRTLRARRSRF